MILSKNKWKLKYSNPYNDDEVIDILHKIKGIDDYVFYHNLSFKDFNDPYLFKNMDIVVKKIKLSIRNNEKILIYGDYDVDGITATAILYRTLKNKDANVYFKVPNRFQDGYGLCNEVVDEIISEGFNLVITVDNGITSVDEIKKLTDNGISVILTDHHEPKESIPETDYILHSYLYNDYPFANLCGAGVSFKLAEAIDKDFIREYTDLVMLGTIADMMPIVGENKAIVNEGIKRINDSKCKGLKMLVDYVLKHDLKKEKIEFIKDISFNIAPKINSLGRIGDASIAIDLLIQEDEYRIENDIKALLDADKLRKELTVQNTELAYKLINPNDAVHLIYSSQFYEGVLGIIAQKIMKKTGKITGVFNVNQDNYARGSFRTIGDVNVLELLEKNKDLLDKFGGHEKACGVNMKASNIKELRERLSKEVLQKEQALEQTLDASLELNHTLISAAFIKDLKKYDMIDTLFLFKDLEVIQTRLYADKHTKVECRLKNGNRISVMCFGDAKLSFNLSNTDLIDVVGEININNYNGYDYIQINAKDYRVNGIQIIDYRNRFDFDKAIQYFDMENGLILRDEFDNLADFDLLIRDQSPNIIYLAPINASRMEELRVTDLVLLKQAIYLISLKSEYNEIMLLKELRISKNVLNPILSIFEELGLISRQNGKIYNLPRENGHKVNLETSITYKSYQESNEVLTLLRENIKNIKEHVLETLE